VNRLAAPRDQTEGERAEAIAMSMGFLAGCGLAGVAMALLIPLISTSAVASPVIAPSFGHSMPTTRFEPPRPGGLPGEARETTPFWHSDNTDQALVGKPKGKRRRH
jgi:hypothetical protein